MSNWKFAALLLVACAREPVPVSVTEAASGRYVALARGQNLVITLTANPSTGYNWSLADSAADVVVIDGPSTFTPDRNTGARIGASGTERWVFHGAVPGNGHLRLVYGRPWERDAPPAREFTLEVSVR